MGAHRYLFLAGFKDAVMIAATPSRRK